MGFDHSMVGHFVLQGKVGGVIDLGSREPLFNSSRLSDDLISGSRVAILITRTTIYRESTPCYRQIISTTKSTLYKYAVQAR